MGAMIKTIPISEAKERLSSLPYAMAQGLSDFQIGTRETVGVFDEAESVEARYFSPKMELHIFREGEGVSCVMVTDGDASYVDTEYELAGRFQNAGSSVTVRKYLDEDEDGQCYVSATRLLAIKGE